MLFGIMFPSNMLPGIFTDKGYVIQMGILKQEIILEKIFQ